MPGKCTGRRACTPSTGPSSHSWRWTSRSKVSTSWCTRLVRICWTRTGSTTRWLTASPERWLEAWPRPSRRPWMCARLCWTRRRDCASVMWTTGASKACPRPSAPCTRAAAPRVISGASRPASSTRCRRRPSRGPCTSFSSIISCSTAAAPRVPAATALWASPRSPRKRRPWWWTHLLRRALSCRRRVLCQVGLLSIRDWRLLGCFQTLPGNNCVTFLIWENDVPLPWPMTGSCCSNIRGGLGCWWIGFMIGQCDWAEVTLFQCVVTPFAVCYETLSWRGFADPKLVSKLVHHDISF